MSSALFQAVTSYIDRQGGGQGLFPTPMPSFNIVRSFETMMPMRALYRPSLCVVLRGAKELYLGDDRLTYGEMECLIVSVEVPAKGRIVDASADSPYLGVTVDFDVAMLRDVLEHLDEPPTPEGQESLCAFVGKVDEHLSDCLTRLVRLSSTPKGISILYPSVMREICYWLLTGPYGASLARMAMPESSIERVVKAIGLLHVSFARTLRIEQLAETAGMSPSSFHQHFKALTSMTPLQFQKQLRLLEARRLMMTEAASVTEAAYQVGYESASQFSREYSRSFGTAPKKDALFQRRLYAKYAGRTVDGAETYTKVQGTLRRVSHQLDEEVDL
jgi:AraC-like DNA-binding protein